MTIPAFEEDGLLPKGIWQCKGEEFISRFCKGDHRKHFAKAAQDVFDFALSKGASHILVGGSFVTSEKKPRDLDCAIIFETEKQIPDRAERLVIEGTKLDIFFCARTQPKIVAGFSALFQKTRSDRTMGIVIVELLSAKREALWEVRQEPDEGTLEIIKRVYFQRHVVDRNSTRKALITVHGIKSEGEWSAEVCHIASSNGWIVAPFSYGYRNAGVLSEPSERREIVDQFRRHIYDIRDRYGAQISVIAHSFGTYVVVKYLLGFDSPPVVVDTLILTGSILTPELDLNRFEGRAAKIIHEVAPQDSVVKYAKPGSLWSDELFGKSGQVGFTTLTERIEQRTAEIFTHNNVIRRDVIAQRWMPWLELNVGEGYAESIKVLAKKFLREQANNKAENAGN